MPHDDLLKNTGKVLTDQHVALYRDPMAGFTQSAASAVKPLLPVEMPE